VRAGWRRRGGDGFATAADGGRAGICGTVFGGQCRPQGDGIRNTYRNADCNADTDCFAVAYADENGISEAFTDAQAQAAKWPDWTPADPARRRSGDRTQAMGSPRAQEVPVPELRGR
jgi:hypothetical protein